MAKGLGDRWASLSTGGKVVVGVGAGVGAFFLYRWYQNRKSGSSPSTSGMGPGGQLSPAGASPIPQGARRGPRGPAGPPGPRGRPGRPGGHHGGPGGHPGGGAGSHHGKLFLGPPSVTNLGGSRPYVSALRPMPASGFAGVRGARLGANAPDGGPVRTRRPGA